MSSDNLSVSTSSAVSKDLFSPLGKLADRVIYFADVFLYFYFLMIDFPKSNGIGI